MKVRDLRQYISEITGTEYSISNLGSHREPFLVYMAGQFQNVEQVKGFIESSSSFATNAEEQLFYEFVQNAYDADADSLYFFANDKFLVVLNNGEPFYTDFNLLADEKNHGQLFNFLAKGKSDKRGDDNQMGQFGQGSKLLYTLITDSSDGQLTDAELLVEAIYDNQKGPYLISWNSKDQLTNLLYCEQNWELSQADDYKNNILFAKILYSYFPIAPGQELSLFSNREASDVISVFDKLVDPRRNLHYMNKGTALIIPLGKGKAAKINNRSNLDKVRTRLGGFSALTADQKAAKSKLKHIFVLNEEIEQTDVVSVSWQKVIGNKKQKFHIAFNPVFAQDGYVNFFKGLPILSTRYHLGFIIDSQCFQTDDSRQRLTNKDTVEHQLDDIFSELVSRLKDIKNKESEKFDDIYDAIMACRIEKDEESSFIMRPFNNHLKPFLQANVRTDCGQYHDHTNVFLPATKYDFEIPLSQLGISSKSWADPSIRKSLSYMGISLSSLDLQTVIVDSPPVLLQKWIKNLPQNEYASFQMQCYSFVQQGKLLNTKLFCSDKNNLFSYNELISNSPIYYGFGDVAFNGLEHIPVNFIGDAPYDYPLILINKIQSQLSVLRSSNVLKDTSVKMLMYIAQKRLDQKETILSLKLFENRQGNLCAMNDLFADVPTDSCLFDDFQVKGYLPDSLKKSGWMLNPIKDAHKAWEWIVNHINELIKVDGWDTMASKYIGDLRSLYNLVPKEKNPSLITDLYFDESGMPTTIVYSMVKNCGKLSEGDYALLQNTFSNEKLLPYKFYRQLGSVPFGLNKLGISDLVEDGKQVTKDQLMVLGKVEESFLIKYYLKEINGDYKIYPLNGGQNYVNELESILENSLARNGFYHIPESAQSIFKDCAINKEFDLSNNTELINSIILQYDTNALTDIFPLVENCHDSVLLSYYTHLQELPINNKLDETDTKWRIIEVAVRRSNKNCNLKQLIFDKIRHNNLKLADEIVNEIVEVADHKYDIYMLDGDYKVSNGHITSFLECLPANKDQFFKKEFYNGKQTTIASKSVYLGLFSKELTLEQLKFCLDYAFVNKLEGVTFNTLSSVGATEVLNMVEVNKFKGFDKYYNLAGFNSSQQVYAESKILLDREKLPSVIYSWLESHPDGSSLFNNLRSSDENLMIYRQYVKDVKRYSGSLSLSNDSQTRDTLDWLLSQHITCAKDSDQYKNLLDFVNGLPGGFVGMPFFQYDGEVSVDSGTNVKANLKFCLYSTSKPFLNGAGVEFAECLSSEQNLKTFIKNSSVYEYPGAANIYKHNLITMPVWEVRHGFVNGNYKEFDYSNYKVWKAMRESDGITLFTSDKPIGVTLSIYFEKTELFSVKRRNSDCGNNPITKQVVIRYPNDDDLSKMKTLEKHSKGISWLKDPLIALFGLYVNETDELQKIADDKGMDIRDVIEVAKNTLEGTGVDASTLKAIYGSPEVFKNIASSFDDETLKKISNNPSMIQNLLNEFSKSELSIISSLPSSLIKSLKNISKNDLELFLKNSDKFKTWISSGGAEIDNDMIDLFTKFTDGFNFDTPEMLGEQLDLLHDTLNRFGKDGWEKLRKNTDTIVDIVDKFSDEELKKIAESSQNLHDFLDELEQQNEQTDKEPSISSIIGYIGELIFEQYLVQNKIKYEFSADKGVSQYDFVVYPSTSGKERYIDVKTTRNTLTDGHSPMYIHKSQDDFLKSHPDAVYRFIRVSLHDLKDELEYEYELLRDQYGSNADPRNPKNIGLRKDCQDIAKKYWSRANISDFEEASPVYRIEFVNP